MRALIQFQNAVQHQADARGFYLGQTAAGDRLLDIIHASVRHRLQRAEPLHQAAKRPLGVAVGGVLRKDCKHQLVGRVQPRFVGKRAVRFRQQTDGIGDGDSRFFSAPGAARFGGSFRRHCYSNTYGILAYRARHARIRGSGFAPARSIGVLVVRGA